jgi:nickel-dependent lactate racemase
MMQVRLAYGKSGLTINFPDDVDVISPKFVAGLADETSAMRGALRNPLGAKPLREIATSGDNVVIVFPDRSRPMPSSRVLPVILSELSHLPTDKITLLNALGVHRPNTSEELTDMLGADIVKNYRILQHRADDGDMLVHLGRTSFGHEIWINRIFLEAQVKVLTGFIEPHFFAGFSGGPKAVMPGVSGVETISGNHSAKMIDDPNATWGETETNPVYQEMAEVADMVAPEFLVNVTLNSSREITGIFAGQWREAHRAGCAFVRQSAMCRVDSPYDVVVTSNAGFPLDANLYQAVKGLSVAARIVRHGGTIIIAAACTEGITNHENFYRLLRSQTSPEKLISMMLGFPETQSDQWQVQILAHVLKKADVLIHSLLPEEAVRACHMRPVKDIALLLNEMREKTPKCRIAVLPEGPETIPYIK